MRRVFIPLLGLLALACGQSPDGSTPSATAPAGFTLADGTYSLVVVRTQASICAVSGGSVMGAELAVSLRSADGGWRVSLTDTTSGDFLMTLTPKGTLVSGRISGQGSVGGVTTSFGDTAVSGGIDGASSATGSIEGFVTYVVDSGWTSCNETRWTLGPRR